MDTLALSGYGRLVHINLRRDKSAVVADLKVAVKDQPSDLLSCFALDAATSLRAAFWSDDGSLRVWLDAPLSFAGEVRDMSVAINGIRLDGCVGKRWTLLPQDHLRLLITCSITASPTAQQVRELALLLGEDVQLSMLRHADLLALTPDAVMPAGLGPAITEVEVEG